MRRQPDIGIVVADEPGREEIVAWRRSQLERAGFPQELALGVAGDGRYDLHRLIELLEHGCAPELALRILAPLEGDEAA